MTRTAERLNVNPAFVEKDFWVTELLRAVSSGDQIAVGGNPMPVRAVFKGGTSLSRVFHLINRFSEDVDILLVFPDGTGTGSRDKAMKRIVAGARTHLGLPEDACTTQESTTGIKRNVRYAYPRRFHSQVTREYLLLEMGSRGGPDPHQRHDVRSMVAEFAIDELGEDEGTWQEFAAVSIEVLAPERTLLEKLALLHNLAVRFQDDAMAQEYMARAGRHYYDIHQLLTSDLVCDRLRALGRPGVVELVDDVNTRSAAAGWRFVNRPAGGYADSPAFDPDGPARRVAEHSYGVAMGMVYGRAPAFEDCLDAVHQGRPLL